MSHTIQMHIAIGLMEVLLWCLVGELSFQTASQNSSGGATMHQQLMVPSKQMSSTTP